MEQIRFSADARAQWAGMGDYRLTSPDGHHQVEIPYAAEAPHGDSIHQVTIDGRALPGYAWGCMFAFSPCSRYAAFSWMSTLYERKTVVVDMDEAKYTVLPEYVYDFVLQWPELKGVGNESDKSYVFDGSESWRAY